MRFLLFSFVFLAAILAVSQERAQPSAAQAQSRPANPPFSEGVAEGLLSELRDGIVGQDRGATLALFDQERMPDYSDFAERIGLMLERYDSFQVRYQLLQIAEETGANVAIVDLTLEAIPASENQLPVRRSAQLRFTFSQGKAGWKISDLQPRDFFAQF